MRKLALTIGILLLFVGEVYAGAASPQKTITIPSGPTAIPPEVSNQMNRQEQRLDDIDKRLAVMERVVGEMDANVKELVKTDTIISFLVGMVKIFIPGIFLTYFGIWLNRKMKERKSTPPTNA